MLNFCKGLILWYDQHKRNLPWRNTKDPYLIWVSEVVLQQTRVVQGLSYYVDFSYKFPDVFSLANANIDDLMRVWQGLGYYSRARNMKVAARQVVEDYQGVFPQDFNELIKLKGVGQYTAAAIASFAFGKKVPLFDGNVYRVLARIFGIFEPKNTAKGLKKFMDLAWELIPDDSPDIYNQAIMEFGALQCAPKNPDCSVCPFKLNCYAFENNLVDVLPLPKPKVIQKTRYFNYIYIIYGNDTFIEKRIGDDIWKYLYQLPLIETTMNVGLTELMGHREWQSVFGKEGILQDIHIYKAKHILSHQKLECNIYMVKIEKVTGFVNKNYKKIAIGEIKAYSFPRLLEKYFEVVNN